MRKPNIVRGRAAIQLVRSHGVPLLVLNLSGAWVVGGAGALARAERLLPHAAWIYGADASMVSREHGNLSARA